MTNSSTMEPRLLILGGSILQIPAILEARALGIPTAVLDYDPHCRGRYLADRFFLASTNNPEAVLACARSFQATGIMTLCTDWPMRSVAYASEALNLCSISYEAACVSTNKLDMIRALEKAGLSHPWYVLVNGRTPALEMVRDLPLPCIIKPVDSSGSRGVVLIRSQEQWPQALAYSATFARTGEVLIEEFMEGPEVSVEILILSGEPHVLAITDKTTTGYPHFVETCHVQPSSLAPADQEAIRTLAKASCRALNLTTGAAHVEIILTKEGPKLVEVGPRMGGDFIATHLVPLSTGINMTELTIREALGEHPVLPESVPRAACIRYIHRGPGRYKRVQNLGEVQTLPGVLDVHINLPENHLIGELKSSHDRLGHIIVQAETAAQAWAWAQSADESLQIIMEHETL
ncbi:Phosphoribosylglycinamide synthetase, ATP-grasp (A) domain protein [Clostridiaceae bacterium JG1575]|nr:Phosphoribosylglycinamide synthetase, ATP-grasp (A) domain protein [Clostridiaceae bacterium JG1575]